MNRTKIEWTDYSWNPIKGICPVNCKLPDGQSYCYARRMYQRFKWNPELDLVSYNDLQKPRKIKKPSRIFLCSTIEFFHPDIHPSWREVIFDVIRNCPQHTFQILTKFPQNIDREMPENVQLGITVTNNDDILSRHQSLLDTKARIKFISYEPILGWLNYFPLRIDWLILGRLAGFGKKHNPDDRYIRVLIRKAIKENIPVFLKNNLIPIIGKEWVMKHRELPRLTES